MKQLCVLLSAYNGEKYIIEQLNSIFSQVTDYCHIKVLIRDDGSKDNTVGICREYAKKNGFDIEVIEGENVKPARSFLKLIAICPESDYYAFCDQDDIWLPGKVRAAISCVETREPVLWISNYNVVDADLNVILSNALDSPETDPMRILFYNNVPGCVMVFNRYLLEEIRSLEIDDFRMHDILTLDVAELIGRVVFDNKPYILYRQHGDNVLGFGHKKIKSIRWIKEKVRYLNDKEDYHVRDYAQIINEKYRESLPNNTLNEFALVANYRSGIIGRLQLLRKPYTKNGLNRTSISIRWKIMLGVF